MGHLDGALGAFVEAQVGEVPHDQGVGDRCWPEQNWGGSYNLERSVKGELDSAAEGDTDQEGIAGDSPGQQEY